MKKILLSFQFRDLFLLSARFLLAIVFLAYGGAKLAGLQFGGLSIAEHATPIKDLSLFKVAWYLFAHEPFNFFTGICEIIAALLLLFRRTAIVGTLMLIPIIVNILIIDIMIMPPGLKTRFIFRLSFYLILCTMLLYANSKKLVAAWKILTAQKMCLKRPFWQYLFVTLLILLFELILHLCELLYFILISPEETFANIGRFFS